MPETIALIVKHIGGYGFDKGMPELIEVIEDGVSRPPKTSDLNIAIIWLIKQKYQVQGYTWLDRPGLLSRRRRMEYAHSAN